MISLRSTFYRIVDDADALFFQKTCPTALLQTHDNPHKPHDFKGFTLLLLIALGFSSITAALITAHITGEQYMTGILLIITNTFSFIAGKKT